MTVVFKFILCVLATWRVTYLLAKEDGPGNIFAQIRKRLGRSFWGKLMDCFNCLSIWVAVPFTFFFNVTWLEKGMIWLALSGGAMLLYKWTQEPFLVEEGEDNGML